jgi:hypothetical protein
MQDTDGGIGIVPDLAVICRHMETTIILWHSLAEKGRDCECMTTPAVTSVFVKM